MDLDRAIVGRRSRRHFSDDPVSEEDVQTLIEAGQAAPSWANTQCVRYIVVRDPAMKEDLVKTTSERNPARKALLEAPVALVFVARVDVSGHKQGEPVDDKAWYMFDTGMAVQNVCLKAHAMGMGTVVVGFFDYRRAGELLGVPEGFQVVALTPVGIPNDEPGGPPRLDLVELVHKETWNG